MTTTSSGVRAACAPEGMRSSPPSTCRSPAAGQPACWACVVAAAVEAAALPAAALLVADPAPSPPPAAAGPAPLASRAGGRPGGGADQRGAAQKSSSHGREPRPGAVSPASVPGPADMNASPRARRRPQVDPRLDREAVNGLELVVGELEALERGDVLLELRDAARADQR